MWSVNTKSIGILYSLAERGWRCSRHSPLLLLTFQDDVVLDQGGLALAHPPSLWRHAHPPPAVGTNARAPDGGQAAVSVVECICFVVLFTSKTIRSVCYLATSTGLSDRGCQSCIHQIPAAVPIVLCLPSKHLSLSPQHPASGVPVVDEHGIHLVSPVPKGCDGTLWPRRSCLPRLRAEN